MVSSRLFNRLFPATMKDRRGLKPLFRRRKLATLGSFNDNQGAQHFTEYVQRTMPLNHLTGENDMFYKMESDDILITTDGTTWTHTIRPPDRQVWLLDSVSISQSDNQKRLISIVKVMGTITIPIYSEDHVYIATGGAVTEQTLFPIWHDVSGGVEQDHFAGRTSLQMDNQNYMRIKGFNFAATKTVIIKWEYRRVR